MKTTPLWTLSAETVENSRMAQFMAEINSADRLNGFTVTPRVFEFARRGSFLGEKHGIFWVSYGKRSAAGTGFHEGASD